MYMISPSISGCSTYNQSVNSARCRFSVRIGSLRIKLHEFKLPNDRLAVESVNNPKPCNVLRVGAAKSRSKIVP